MAVNTSPKPGRHKEQRIIAGAAHYVTIENDKIVEDLGPVKMYQYPEQKQPKIVETPKVTEEQPNIVETPKVTEEQPKIGLQLIAEDGTYIVPPGQVKETSDKTTIKPNSVPEEQKPRSGIQLTPVSSEDLGTILKQEKQYKQNKTEPAQTPKLGKKPEWEDILARIPEPDPNRPNLPESTIEQTKVSESTIEQTKASETTAEQIKTPEPKKSHIPIIEPIKKPPQIPKITIPKVQINVPPKSIINKPIKPENISNKPGETLTADTYSKPKEFEVVDPGLQKANENTWVQQPVINREKSTEEKRRFMSEELEAELLDERKFEQWMKKQKFHENLAKAAKFAEETKEQFEEKIPELSNKIEGITGEVKGVENRLGTVDDRLSTVDKSIGTLCTGIDCVKEDVKKFQTSQEALERLIQEKYQTSHQALEKLVQDRFSELGEKVQGLERPTFTCENCGEQVIAPLSSYCPNCGSEIQSWSDEDGEPVRGWSPYWRRLGRSTSQ